MTARSSANRRTPTASRAEAFARLFEAVHEGVFIGTLAPSESREPCITQAANPHLKRIFGYAPDLPEPDVAPFTVERFGEPAARVSFLERLSQHGTVTDHLLGMRRLDGSSVWVEVTARAGRAHAPDVMRIEALVRDVSARKRSDDQSREIYQQLLQAEKMAALGQTISGVAHELNNPLATILSWAERLAERPLDDTSRRGVDVILAESDRAARIVRNLLTFARKRQSTRAMIDVNQTIRETLALRAYEHRLNNIRVIEALAPILPDAFADGHQIQQVLLNLIINAEQAMLSAARRGSLLVRSSHDAAAETIVVEVTDDGPGVPQDLRGRIFDPFFTTKEVGKGTGLGLTVAYAITQEHGGRIRLESNPGSGASFFVELPVSGVAHAVRKPRSVAPPMEAVRGAAVLIVEDEEALASAVAEALTDAGLQTECAGDGEDALARVRNATYDLVICDLKMPRMDGITFYRAIAAGASAAVPRVIFVTGDVADTDAERFLEESGCRWLAKPFRLAELLSAVRDALA